jgi:hypothetical protein
MRSFTTRGFYKSRLLPLRSLECLVALSARDWAATEEDAWLYGVVIGWGDEALRELAREFRWPRRVVSRLKRLHDYFENLIKEESL